jgi:riboflavin synthase
VEIDANSNILAFDISSESMTLTNLGQLKVNDSVNLELALRVGDRLGGHQVTGHIDGLATVVEFKKSSDGSALTISIPSRLSRYVIVKGSLAIDGVSLTVNSIEDKKEFSLVSLMIIPATLQKTNFQTMSNGKKLNLEVDIMGKYFERFLATSNHQPPRN